MFMFVYPDDLGQKRAENVPLSIPKEAPLSGSDRHLSRRDWLKATLPVGAAVSLSGCVQTRLRGTSSTMLTLHGPSPMKRENERPGTRDWLLTNTRIDAGSRYRSPWIEGYCSHRSIRLGEKLSVFVSTNPPSKFTIEIYRMGFYGGAGGRSMLSLGPFEGRVQPDPS